MRNYVNNHYLFTLLSLLLLSNLEAFMENKMLQFIDLKQANILPTEQTSEILQHGELCFQKNDCFRCLDHSNIYTCQILHIYQLSSWITLLSTFFVF